VLLLGVSNVPNLFLVMGPINMAPSQKKERKKEKKEV
jgi:hypothetical protein